MTRLFGLFLMATACVAIALLSPPTPLVGQVKEVDVKASELLPKLKTLPKVEPKAEEPVRKSDDGFPIPLGAVHRFGNRQLRHAGGAYQAVASPDGKLLATRSLMGVVVWDLATLNAKQVLTEGDPSDTPYYYGRGGGLAFTADSKGLMATTSRVRTGRGAIPDVATMWDVETGKKRFACRGGSGYESAAWTTADGKKCGLFSDYQTVRFFDATDGKALESVNLPTPIFQNVVVSPDGELITGSDGNLGVRVYETRTGKLRTSFDELQGYSQLAFTPDSKTVVYQDAEGKVHVHDLDAKKERFAFAHPADKQAGPMRIAKDNRTLFFGGTQGQLYRWDLKENKRLPDVGKHSTWTLTAIALSPDEKTLYSMGMDCLIRRWDLTVNKQVEPPQGYTTRTTLFPEADGKTVLIADHVGRIDRWDLASGKVVEQLHPGQVQGINCLTRSRDGRWLAAGCTTQNVKIWDLNRKEIKDPIWIEFGEGDKKSGTDHLQRIALSPDGKTLFGSTEKTGLSAYEIETGKRLWNVEKGAFAFALDPRGQRIVSRSGRYEPGPVRLQVTDAATGKPLREIEVPPLSNEFAPNANGNNFPWTTDFAFLPDGSLVSTHYDGTIRVTDMEAGKERRWFFAPNRSRSLNVVASPDGRWLALVEDRRIRLVELASGREVYTLTGHDSAISQVAFTRDGKGLISSADLAPLLWDLKPRDLPKLGTDDEIWEQLASEDAAKVYRLQWALWDEPARATKLLAEKVKPAEWQSDRPRYEQLLKNLDTARFAARETAQRELTDSPKIPLSWLHASLRIADSEEVRERLHRIVETREKRPATREWRILRSVQLLERIATPETEELLRKWATAGEGSVLASDASATLERMKPEK